jgi:hypothetical protein
VSQEKTESQLRDELDKRLQQYREMFMRQGGLPFLCIGFGYLKDRSSYRRAITMLDDNCQPDQAIDFLTNVLEMLKAKYNGIQFKPGG